MSDGASQVIYCNFTKNRKVDEILRSFTRLWDLHPIWKVFDHKNPDKLNPRFIRMDSERSYKSANVLSFLAERGYQIVFTPPRDKHTGGIAERIAKTNTSMMENMAPNYMWCWAMFKATQELNFNYNTSPYHFVTGQHIDMEYLHSLFAECYMFRSLKDRKGKLPYR